MKWLPDTCYCVVECDSPAKNGKFLKKCRVHVNSTRTTDVYQHNLSNRIRATEQGTETKEEIGAKRKRDLRETTKP